VIVNDLIVDVETFFVGREGSVWGKRSISSTQGAIAMVCSCEFEQAGGVVHQGRARKTKAQRVWRFA